MGFKDTYLKKGPNPYFIAEIGINHNGHVELARQMIDESLNAGSDAVKFQKRNISYLLHPDAVIEEPTGYLSKDENDISEERKAYGTWVYPDKRVELNDDQFIELWEYSESKGLDFFVSPWEEKSVDFLVKNGAKAIKIASIDALNYQFCEYISSKGLPTLVSSGMANYQQIMITKSIFDKAKCPMMFLHCTSAYPSPVEDKNLKCIPKMKDIFDMDIGFSGHRIGFEGTLGAIALGANVVEKHVTLNREMNGTDHAASLEFDEFRELIIQSKNMIKALGNDKKEFLDSEQTLFNILSKRFVTTYDIKKGEKLTAEKIRTVVTKKEGGMTVDQYYNILGFKAVKNLKANHIIENTDLES